jgi:pantoate kinase
MAEKVLTRKQIERILGRGRKLLHALSRKPAIRRIVDQAGYTEEEHKLGWALWLYLMGY